MNIIKPGQSLDLTKAAPGLRRVMVGLGWSIRNNASPHTFDVDAIGIATDAQGLRLADNTVLFFNQRVVFPTGNHQVPGALMLSEDDRDGSGDDRKDDEVIFGDLTLLTQNRVGQLVVGASIHRAEERGQHFGQLNDAFIRLVNAETKQEITRLDLDAFGNNATEMTFGAFRFDGTSWRFDALGKPQRAGLQNYLGVAGQYYSYI